MILVCGEALIDLFVATLPENEPSIVPAPLAGLHSLAAQAVAGGSPFNVAVGLARLTASSGFFGGLSRDGLGRFLLGLLEREGVDVSLVRHSDRPTPLVVVAPEPDGQPGYTFHAADCAYQDVPLGHLPPQLPATAEALVFGSFSLTSEPVGSTLLALAEREATRRVISLDPNVRSALAGDPVAWRERFACFARVATLIKLSVEDVRLAYGEDADPAERAAAWLSAGVLLVVVTDGAAGATAYHACGRVVVPAQRVQVVDTVGAGDSLHAALLARLLATGRLTQAAIAGIDAATLHDILGYAVRAAGVTCSRRGADLPTRDELG